MFPSCTIPHRGSDVVVGRTPRAAARFFVGAVLGCLLAGCKSLYFQPVDSLPEMPVQHALAKWPEREYWAGIVFNGNKIGFSHLTLDPTGEPGLFEIRSDTAFVLRFLGYDKRINLRTRDIVRSDLDLVRFSYDYSIDGNTLALSGERRGDSLDVTVMRGDRAERESIVTSGPLYPQSAIALYPSLKGLAVGRTFRYPVYSGELQRIAELEQRVEAYEKSPLFTGNAFRLETAMEGYRVETWIDARARPLLEIGMNGVLISGLEDEKRARSYLAAASLNKNEALLEFALARPEQPLSRPRQITAMRIALSGGGIPPSDSMQQCILEGGGAMCEVRSAGRAGRAEPPADNPRYLASTFAVPASDSAIQIKAREIAGDAKAPREQIKRIVEWIGANVRTSAMDVWTALDVLQKREAECQGHTWLYAALARSLGIPTRVVNGIVYSEAHGGFLYHTWAESVIDGQWLSVDPTFGAVPADATHVTLAEGETVADLTPLADWIGRLKVKVMQVRYE